MLGLVAVDDFSKLLRSNIGAGVVPLTVKSRISFLRSIPTERPLECLGPLVIYTYIYRPIIGLGEKHRGGGYVSSAEAYIAYCKTIASPPR